MLSPSLAFRRLLVGLVVVGAGLLVAAPPAAAQRLGHAFYAQQPPYTLELEPHLVAGMANPPGPGVGQGAGFGVRGSVVLSRDGFIDGVNDSLAIGFGADVLRYRGLFGNYYGTCVQRAAGPAGTSICTEVDTPGGPRGYLFVPVVLQWNFWLNQRWSLFGEPGIDFFFTNHGGGITPSLSVGGRFQLNDVVALILRLGWPTTTLGVSFLL
ncbi:MAG TPA: hypothetical protein VGP07_07060 [Polyangia bacterium]|jgi:hypothetical protein